MFLIMSYSTIANNNNNNNNYNSAFVAKPTLVTGLSTPPLHPPRPPPNNSPIFPPSTDDYSYTYLSYTYNLARVVKFIAAIDVFFAFLYIFSAPYIFLYSFLNLIMGIVGFNGASKYKKNQVLSYGVYCVVKIVVNIIVVIIVGINYKNTDNPITGFVLLNSLIILLEAYLTFIVFRLYKTLNKATIGQLIELRNGPRTVNLVLW